MIWLQWISLQHKIQFIYHFHLYVLVVINQSFMKNKSLAIINAAVGSISRLVLIPATFSAAVGSISRLVPIPATFSVLFVVRIISLHSQKILIVSF